MPACSKESFDAVSDLVQSWHLEYSHHIQQLGVCEFSVCFSRPTMARPVPATAAALVVSVSLGEGADAPTLVYRSECEITWRAATERPARLLDSLFSRKAALRTVLHGRAGWASQ